MINDICELLLLEQQEEPTESFAHEIVTDIVNDIIINVLDNVPKDIGVEPTISSTPTIKIESTNGLVELEPMKKIEATNELVELEPINNLVTHVPDVQICIPSKFSCIDCGYYCTRNAHLLKHFASMKHLTRNQIVEADLACKHQCKICNKKYKGQSGLWLHSKKCKKVSQEGSDLLQEFSNLERVMSNLTELVKNQRQLTNDRNR
jgi:hypothetical protein